MNLVSTYLELVRIALASATDANVDAVEAFEAAHPEVIDLAYQADGPYEYDPVTGTVYAKVGG